jgi:hypothetical protein
MIAFRQKFALDDSHRTPGLLGLKPACVWFNNIPLECPFSDGLCHNFAATLKVTNDEIADKEALGRGRVPSAKLKERLAELIERVIEVRCLISLAAPSPP